MVHSTSWPYSCRGIDLTPYVEPRAGEWGKTFKYDLLANIIHDGLPGAGKGSYRVCMYHKVCVCACMS